VPKFVQIDGRIGAGQRSTDRATKHSRKYLWPVPEPPPAYPLPMLALLTTPVGRFRLFAIAEAWSWAGLLLGMLFKYVVVKNPIGVQIMGPVHGLLFVLYAIFTIEAMMHLRKPIWVLVLGLLAAFPPFTTWWFERWVLRGRA
jgi:integral membrane protein